MPDIYLVLRLHLCRSDIHSQLSQPHGSDVAAALNPNVPAPTPIPASCPYEIDGHQANLAEVNPGVRDGPAYGPENGVFAKFTRPRDAPTRTWSKADF